MLKPNGRIRNAVVIGTLCLVVGFAYLNSFSNGFTNWDDPNGIINNLHIRSLNWQNVKRIFTPGTTGSYQPLRTLSLAVDYHFWKLNPFGYHVTNLLFYALTCIMVFLTTERLLAFLRKTDDPWSNFRVALFSSLVFAVHPVHVEAVAWLSARKEVLLGFFFFLAMVLYLRAKEAPETNRKIVFYSLAFLGFLGATFSKPTAVVLPVLLILFELSAGRLERFSFKKVMLCAPFVTASIWLSYVLVRAMRGMGGIKDYTEGSFLSNLLIVPHIYVNYLKLLTVKVNYSHVYNLSLPNPLWSLSTVLYILVNAGMLACAILAWKRARIISFAILWFYVTILPVSNIIPISTLLADRYAFLASFGLCLILGLAFERLYQLRHPRWTPQFFKVLSASILALLVLVYAYTTFEQNKIWKNSYTLWANAAARSPDNHMALSGLAVVYIEGKMYEEAKDLLERAVQIEPNDPIAVNNLGLVYFNLGRTDEAHHAYLKALSLSPYLREAHRNLARLYIQIERYDEAESVYRHFLEKHPRDALMHHLLGELYRTLGRTADARAEYEKAADLAPHIATPYEALGILYRDHYKDREEALRYFELAAKRATESRKTEDIQRLIKSLSESDDLDSRGVVEGEPIDDGPTI